MLNEQSNIPTLSALQELQARPQWVCWRYEERKGKRTKVPYNPHTGQRAESNNPETWASYTLARAALQKHQQRYDGIGYMFHRDITGVDLDHCITSSGGIEPWAQAYLTRLASYAEYSPSETGIHILVHGTIPKGVRRKIPGASHPDAAIEMYCEGRYFTITENQVEETPAGITTCQEGLNDIYREITTPAGNATTPQHLPSGVMIADDEQLIRKATTASNGDKFQRLFVDGATGYLSASEADMALCMLLAFWTGKDKARMDRLFRQSALCRDKWDGPRGDRTYGEITLDAAITRCAVVYDPERTRRQLEQDIHQLLEQLAQYQGKQSSNKKRKPYQIQPKDVPGARILEYLEKNEYGDALFFAEVFAGQVCYDHTDKEWYLWDGNAWKRDGTSKVRQLVAGILGTLYLRAAADLNASQAEVDLEIQTLHQQGMKDTDERICTLKDRSKHLAGQIGELRSRAKVLRTAKRMNSVFIFIQAEMGITADLWDTHPWLLPVLNGVIDLQTGICREGEPGDYIRTVAPTEWTGVQTPCPRFERFLSEIFEDKANRDELIAFLQRLLGYAITGLTIHHLFPILYGEEGRNGKDTLLDMLKKVLGPLVGAVSNDVFIAPDKQRSGGAATPHLCDLQGKRLVWGSETKEGDRLNVAQIKKLTGGGDISARQLHGHQYAFAPTHKLLLMTNYKPHADARDKAFWTRACLIDFGMRFVDQPKASNERSVDVTLKDVLLQECSGILAWLVRGCLTWQEQGLNIPSSVQLATGQYRDQEDRLLLFIQECCLIAPDALVKAGDLFKAYKSWYESNQFDGRGMNGKLFGDEIHKRFQRRESNGRRIYQGIGLLISDDPPTLFTQPGSRGSVEGQSQPSIGDEAPLEANRDNFIEMESRGSRGLRHVSTRNEQETPSIEGKIGKDPLHPLQSHASVISQTASQATSQDVERQFTSSTDPLLTDEKHICTTKWEKHKKGGHSLLATRFSAGLWWCEQCTPQRTWMEYGEQVHYPEVLVTERHSFTVKSGRKEWLRFAQEAGYSLVKRALEAVSQPEE